MYDLGTPSRRRRVGTGHRVRSTDSSARGRPLHAGPSQTGSNRKALRKEREGLNREFHLLSKNLANPKRMRAIASRLKATSKKKTNSKWVLDALVVLDKLDEAAKSHHVRVHPPSSAHEINEESGFDALFDDTQEDGVDALFDNTQEDGVDALFDDTQEDGVDVLFDDEGPDVLFEDDFGLNAQLELHKAVHNERKMLNREFFALSKTFADPERMRAIARRLKATSRIRANEDWVLGALNVLDKLDAAAESLPMGMPPPPSAFETDDGDAPDALFDDDWDLNMRLTTALEPVLERISYIGELGDVSVAQRVYDARMALEYFRMSTSDIDTSDITKGIQRTIVHLFIAFTAATQFDNDPEDKAAEITFHRGVEDAIKSLVTGLSQFSNVDELVNITLARNAAVDPDPLDASFIEK